MTANSSYLSHTGLVRKNNEDFIFADDALGSYLLADGMGGHNAGEVASELAVKTAQAYITERLSSAKDEDIPDILSGSMKAAHDAINVKAKTSLSLMGMGSTLVEVIVRNDKAFVCHAGDSRAYLYRDTLQRITRDHTMGDHLLENNILPRERIPEKQWHTLTQAVGVGDPPMPDSKQVELTSGDILLLCSDGLTDMLTDEEIEKVIAEGRHDLDAIASRLIAVVNEKGARDNTSVILVTP